ncbi:hypothetical protein Kfla_5890 [Kribbella flavida DSM 17836]|uniref:Uncharacterized protein n=1 Tax=Kribbella flavida (strain DSM 17836 / JCM 10339 / NBRC 14399) TaxID=479435 RepID=D2PRH6_KRIFD|nr:hypothetical protein [Kribbella flavida]ADB34894.1 hypothetical protein Kfla_5890 [Kribbella flavida DSM 17836]
MRTPNALIGVVLGILLGWAAVALVAYAGTELYTRRAARMADVGAEALPWLLALLAASVVLGVLMSLRSIGAGVMTGAGLLMAVTGVAVQLLPIRTVIDLIKLFELPGTRPRAGVMLLDGSMLFVGVVLLWSVRAGWSPT